MVAPAEQSEPRLRDARLTDEAARPLINGLTAEYARRYDDPGTEMRDADPTEFDPPRGAFVLITIDEEVVAGGGLRALTADRAELKRMWTRPDHRRRGLGVRVLTALEQRARDRGYREVWLVTGPSQPEAVAMYGATGWSRIANFGLYADEPRAISFAKAL